jgi:cell division protein FtsL
MYNIKDFNCQHQKHTRFKKALILALQVMLLFVAIIILIFGVWLLS